MKLDVAQVRAITTGAVRVEEIDNTVHFFRFTKGQEELYKDRSNDFYMKTFASSGICLRFHTDSQTLFFSVHTDRGSSRSYFAFDVFVNGQKIGDLSNFSESAMIGNYTKSKCLLGDFSKCFSLGTGEKEICIYFPWSVRVTLKELVLDDGSCITPVKPGRKMLCFGDSITHGYDAVYPSNKYVSKLADMLDAEEYNKAIGGEIFFPDLAKAREDFEPEYITVAYGTNDWSKCTAEELAHNCKAFFSNVSHNYPNAKIFVITPIWRKDMNEFRPFGEFRGVEEMIQKQAAVFGNISVIHGLEFVPPKETLFADLRLHPNDKGNAIYFENLSKHIKDILEK